MENRLTLLPGQQPVQRAALALLGVDGPRLRARLVDRQHQTTVQQFFVRFGGGGGEQQHHRAFDPIGPGRQLPGLRVFGGAGDGQLAFRLKKLQGVGRL